MASDKPRRSLSFSDTGDLLADSDPGGPCVPEAGGRVISVGDLTKCIRAVIESDELLLDVWVRGEVSNCTHHANGHIYFSMKDESALIRCVIWANVAKKSRFDLANGMSLIVRGRVTLYERQGQYQLQVTEVTPDGIGALYVAYEQLKDRLQGEGLFDAARKKPLPRFPRKVAVITSRTAAALRDMVTVGNRRCGFADILLIPSLMQGDGAEASVVAAIELADGLPDVDVIIVGRGGGSIEDLWTFNTESVARAIAACDKPIVSAIGHETDFTLADFVADLRAPTPSAAAELVFPDTAELLAQISAMQNAMTSSLRAYGSDCANRLRALTRSRCFTHPEDLLRDNWQTLDLLTARLASSAKETVAQFEGRLGTAAARLDALSPLRVLARGYAVVKRADDGRVIERADQLRPGDLTETMLPSGRLISEVKEIREGWK